MLCQEVGGRLHTGSKAALQVVFWGLIVFPAHDLFFRGREFGGVQRKHVKISISVDSAQAKSKYQSAPYSIGGKQQARLQSVVPASEAQPWPPSGLRDTICWRRGVVRNGTQKYFSPEMRGKLALLILSKEGLWHACWLVGGHAPWQGQWPSPAGLV